MNEHEFVTKLAALRVRILREGREVESPETTYRTIIKREGAAFGLRKDALVARAEALARALVEGDPAGLAEVEAANAPQPAPEILTAEEVTRRFTNVYDDHEPEPKAAPKKAKAAPKPAPTPRDMAKANEPAKAPTPEPKRFGAPPAFRGDRSPKPAEKKGG